MCSFIEYHSLFHLKTYLLVIFYNFMVDLHFENYNNLHLWKITIVCWLQMSWKRKRGMLSCENKHKRIYIHIFLSEIHKNTMINDSNWYHFLVDVNYENYHKYHQTKNYICLLFEIFMKREKEEWYLLKLHTKGFLFICF